MVVVAIMINFILHALAQGSLSKNRVSVYYFVINSIFISPSIVILLINCLVCLHSINILSQHTDSLSKSPQKHKPNLFFKLTWFCMHSWIQFCIFIKIPITCKLTTTTKNGSAFIKGFVWRFKNNYIFFLIIVTKYQFPVNLFSLLFAVASLWWCQDQRNTVLNIWACNIRNIIIGSTQNAL